MAFHWKVVLTDAHKELGGIEVHAQRGHGGRLTHFVHASTYFALDFDCPVDTPVLSMADGEASGAACCGFLLAFEDV